MFLLILHRQLYFCGRCSVRKCLIGSLSVLSEVHRRDGHGRGHGHRGHSHLQIRAHAFHESTWAGDGGPGRRLDGKQGMWLSDMYYSLSCALGLDYWLVLAHTGDQVSPLTVDVEHVLAALDEIGPRQQGQD